MTNLIISITIVVILAASIILIKTIMWPLVKKIFRREKRNASAILLNVEQTGVYIDDLTQVILQLQVEPDQGKNFVTELKGAFNEAEIAALHPGTRIFVTYSAHNHKKVFLQKNGLKGPAGFEVRHSNN